MLDEQPDIRRERAIRLFTFLKKTAGLRTRQICSLDEYNRVIWLADVPDEPGCRTAWSPDAPAGTAVAWLKIAKPLLPDPPKPPAAAADWLDRRQVADSSLAAPALREEGPAPVETDAPGGNRPAAAVSPRTPGAEVRALWEDYVRGPWSAWAEEDRRLQKVQRIYTALFSAYQRQQRLGEAYEVVLGLGCLTWRTSDGREIKRHLLTARACLGFEPVQGVITVEPAAAGAGFVLEQEMLEAWQCPGPAEQREIETRLAELGDDLLEPERFAPFFQTWVHAVSPAGRYEDGMTPQSAGGGEPRVRFAPAVILRKRTEQSLIQILQGVIDGLRQGEPIPAGLSRLLELGGEADQAEAPPPAALPETDEIYFPLPANAQQAEIVTALAKRDGVLVQGPPGTGKSHTIANLICHLLATGQWSLWTKPANPGTRPCSSCAWPGKSSWWATKSRSARNP